MKTPQISPAPTQIGRFKLSSHRSEKGETRRDYRVVFADGRELEVTNCAGGPHQRGAGLARYLATHAHGHEIAIVRCEKLPIDPKRHRDRMAEVGKPIHVPVPRKKRP